MCNLKSMHDEKSTWYFLIRYKKKFPLILMLFLRLCRSLSQSTVTWKIKFVLASIPNCVFFSCLQSVHIHLVHSGALPGVLRNFRTILLAKLAFTYRTADLSHFGCVYEMVCACASACVLVLCHCACTVAVPLPLPLLLFCYIIKGESKALVLKRKNGTSKPLKEYAHFIWGRR